MQDRVTYVLLLLYILYNTVSLYTKYACTYVNMRYYSLLYTVHLEPLCYNGNVRLIGGKVESEGTIQVCVNEEWGTVCDDLWGSNDATVVCNQLNFTGKGKNWEKGRGREERGRGEGGREREGGREGGRERGRERERARERERERELSHLKIMPTFCFQLWRHSPHTVIRAMTSSSDQDAPHLPIFQRIEYVRRMCTYMDGVRSHTWAELGKPVRNCISVYISVESLWNCFQTTSRGGLETALESALESVLMCLHTRQSEQV